MRPYISFTEMVSENKLIKTAHLEFTKEMDRLISQHGKLNGDQFNQAVTATIQSIDMTEMQSDILEGFFDTYAGLWFCYGREMADQFVESLYI